LGRSARRVGVRAVLIEVIWERLAAEFEISELAFKSSDDKKIEHGAELVGTTISVWEVENRDPFVGGRFPEETELSQILEGTGAEIQKNIDEMVGVHCELRITERGTRPCYEELNLDEEYEDVQLEIWRESLRGK
jgi:hypothetical protein